MLLTLIFKNVFKVINVLILVFFFFLAQCLKHYNICVCVLVTQLCLTLCDPMDCSSPGSSVLRIFQGRILEWVAIPFSKGSSLPRDQTQVSHIASRLFSI